MSVATLSKSKLTSYRQCKKRFWLELHQKESEVVSDSSKARFEDGNKTGEVAQKVYDPKSKGAQIDWKEEGMAQAIARTATLLTDNAPIFEAGFEAGGARAFADVLLPSRKGGQKMWRMVEVKSSTSVKDYHRDDVAIQTYIARNSGTVLSAVALAYIDSTWVYPGGGDYNGLFVEEDLTHEAFSRGKEVEAWIADAQVVAKKRTEPQQRTGEHCSDPFPCSFTAYCKSQEPQAKYPVQWLPRLQKSSVKAMVKDGTVTDMRELADDVLTSQQLRVKTHTLRNTVFFDAAGAAAELASSSLPGYFLDFETIQFAVPVWKGTRPYQMIPFQFSVHRLSRTGAQEHNAFLDLSGQDPSKAFAQALIDACSERGPVFVYNAAFETARIKELAERFPKLKAKLLAINERVVDLLKIAQKHYYHPSLQGSWSIKKVLPSIAPDLQYSDLEGVQDGGMAMGAYLEAIASKTTPARKAEIEQQLLKYCALDTYAMVRLWQFFTGRTNFAK